MSTPRHNIQGDREPMHQTLQWISDPDGVERARTGRPTGAMVEASNQGSAAAGIPLSTPIKSERILR